MTKKLPHATDWKAREIKDWNATTYRQYLYDQHKERLGRDYIGKPVAMEAKLITNIRKEYGNDVLKEFIDACFTKYKPNAAYKGCNFWFMYTYMREYVLQDVLDRKQRDTEEAQQNEDVETIKW